MARLNLLQITGDAVVTSFSDTEGRTSIHLHLEVYNPSSTATVQIVDHKRYYLTPGGWLENGPWGSADFYGMGPSVAPLARKTFETTTPWDVGLASYLLFDVKLTSGSDTEDLILQIPITIDSGTPWTQFPAAVTPPAAPPERPDPLPFVHEQYPIMIMDPVDLIPIMDGTQAWLLVTGQLPNPWAASIQVSSFQYVVEDGAGNRLTGSFPLRFRTDQVDASGNAIWVDFTTQSSTAGMFSFNHAIDIAPTAIHQWTSLTLTAVSTAGTFTTRLAIATDARAPTALHFPSDDLPGGNWTAFNAPAHDDFTAHNADQSERYALDLLAQKNGDTRVSATGSRSDNTNFWAYGKPARAMDDGVVVFVLSDVPDGLGYTGYTLPPPGGGAWPTNIPAGGNLVVLQHANNRYSLYAHLIPAGPTNHTYPTVGQRVTAGQQIGLIGNAGNTSEPHMHVAQWTFDPITGFHRALPIAFSDVTNLTGTALPGVIAGSNQMLVTLPVPPVTMVTVPDCIDQTEARAATLIANAGLVLGNVTGAPSPLPPPGGHPPLILTVIQQFPAAGTRVRSGSAVNLKVTRSN